MADSLGEHVDRQTATDNRDRRAPRPAGTATDLGTTLDFWDITKLLGRHWRISLPMLLLSVVLTVLAAVHVKPGYVYTAYVELIPPTPAAVPAGRTPPTPRNPWLTQALPTLGNAALLTVQDLTYVQQLKTEGYSDNFKVVIDGSTPLITFTVTAKTRANAIATSQQIVQHYDDAIETLQTSYDVEPADMIASARLDDGTNIKLSYSTLKRVLVVVIGLGLLLTAGVTIGADAWMRRRARRADGTPPPEPDGASRAVAAIEVAGFPGARVLAGTASDGHGASGVPSAPATRSTVDSSTESSSQRANTTATRSGPERPSATPVAPGGERGAGQVHADRRESAARTNETQPGHGTMYDLPADATVVLPKAVLTRDK